MVTPKHATQWIGNRMNMMILGILLFIPGISFGSDLTGHTPQHNSSATTQPQEDHQLDRDRRFIEGTVEEVNGNTIRVDAGEAGGMSPRYLNLENSKGSSRKESFEVGDMIQIEVNAQNKVVKFQPITKGVKNNN